MALLATLAAGLFASSHAQTFRGSVVRTSVARADLETEFIKAGGAQAEILQHQEWLRPLYNALPKDQEGNLEPQSARYALHRLFAGRFGWYVKGLESEGKTWSSSLHEDTLEDWVPPALLGTLQGQQTGSRGVSLKELGILGAAVKLQAYNETTDFMAQLYGLLKLGAEAPNPAAKVQEAIYYEVTRFLSGRVYTAEGAIALAETNTKKYTDWPKVQAWYKAIEQKHIGDKTDVALSTAVDVAMEVAERYADLNQKECHDLKEGLMGLWSKSKTTGRIRLTDFYRFGLQTQWNLDESAGYLKSVGALDDSNASAPMVIIPNYVTLWRNCLQVTQLYTVCCRNECENLLASLEKSLGQPEAAPSRIIELVENLASETMPVPREIPAAIKARLWQIAERHGGQVQLHGRLFAQWMHHAYPNECPFPHVQANMNNLQDEWDGQEEASEEVRTAMVEAETCGSEEAAQQWDVEMPWSDTEVLLSRDAHAELRSTPRNRGAGVYLAGILLAAFLALHLPQAASIRQRMLAQAAMRGCSESKLLIMVLLLAAMLAGLVNRVMLLIVLSLVGVGSHHMSKLGDFKTKKEKELDLYC